MDTDSGGDVIQVVCECRAVTPVQGGKRLLGLANVAISVAGTMTMTINGLRIEREAQGVSVRLPVDKTGHPVVEIDDQLHDAISDVVLAGGLDAGIILERKVALKVGA